MKPSSDFAHNVFINCPIDAHYNPLFHAMVFTIHLLSFRPRCSREASDSGHVRLQKLMNIIANCKFGIHDISRTGPDRENRLPRFNMPFELGVDLGFRCGGNAKCQTKVHLVLDKEQYRYQKFLSDISGQDISAHSNRISEVVTIIRDWLRSATHARDMPSGAIVLDQYRRFRRDLPKMCKLANLQMNQITFPDYSYIVAEWISTKYKKP